MAKVTEDQVKDILVEAYRKSLDCGKCFTVNVVLDGDNGGLNVYTWQGSNISEAVFNGTDKIVKYFSGGNSEDVVQLYLSDTSDQEIIKNCVSHATGFSEEIENAVIACLGDRNIDELTDNETNEIIDIVRDNCEPDAIDWAVDEYIENVWEDVKIVMNEIYSES